MRRYEPVTIACSDCGQPMRFVPEVPNDVPKAVCDACLARYRDDAALEKRTKEKAELEEQSQ